MSDKMEVRRAVSMVRQPLAAADSSKEFNQLFSIICSSYEPCDSYELFLVSRMAAIHWRILRLEGHATEKITKGRAILAAGLMPKLDAKRQSSSTNMLPNGIGLEEINSVKVEVELYRLLQNLRQEFQSSKQRRGVAAARLNENNGYVVSRLNVDLPEKNELFSVEEELAK